MEAQRVIRSKVVHLTSVHAPFDTRILYKECATLVRAGYDVVLIAPAQENAIEAGVRIRAVSKASSRIERLKSTMWQVYRAALQENGDVYHFHDPELASVGMLLKARGKKVVFDIHENLPAQILGKTYLRPALLRRGVARFAAMVEKLAPRVFDGVVIANPRVAQRFSSSNVIVVANYPSLTMIDEAPVVARESDRPVVVYVGGLTPIRGICELVDAMDLLHGSATLWLAGPWLSDAFHAQCMARPGWRYVQYLGYLTPMEVYGALKKADVGVATLHPQENYLTNLPVKAFEYMACTLPVVMSDFSYWREVFEGAAVFVNPKDTEAIAAAIQYLLDHPDEAKRLGETGRRLVEEKYSWEKEADKLLKLYAKLLSETS